ncbi:cytochrome b/b6 domain-containing protein [Rhizobium pusense]|uniref:cytochrome b n=1 Tax=Agrobacterium pusense TaxID=648995 RepID=UPI002447837E|nr:cytochrome b/b6 domain-containing protein [Agrobacterium pusense]MDH1268467.1 cytochrome b/b6 domain-containing protein [Agrobacterium pusense]
MLKSTPSRYGAVPVTIHWLTAVLILMAIITGFRAGGSIDPAAKAALLRVHIPAAIVILLLTIGRIVWWFFLDKKPQPVQGAPAWQEWLARAVHMLFYVVILGMVASGIGMMVLSGAGPTIFGGTGAELPNFMQYPPRIPHGLGANLLIALLIAHLGAALYHQFIRSDGLIWRMWYGR